MKDLSKSFNTTLSSSKIIEWARLVTITGSAQVVIQALALISGILVIRLLPSQEYAFYTLANTMLGTMIVLTDSGISAGVLTQGGKVWQDKQRLGVVIATGMNLRKRFGFFSILISVPVLFLLLRHHGASILTCSLLTISLIPAFYSALSGSLLEIVPKLTQDIRPLQKIQVQGNALRLCLLSLSAIVFPVAYIAVFAASISQLWSNTRLRRIANKYADSNHLPNQEVRTEIISGVRKILPGAIYFCLSGQISIWLISFFGSTDSIAHVGALGRLAMVLNLFSIVFSILIVPRFARMKSKPAEIFSRFLQIQVLVLLIAVLIVGLVYIFPNTILLLLGDKYQGLQKELIYMAMANCAGLLVGVTYSMSISRGIILSPVINISAHILGQIIFALILDLSKTTEVLLLVLADHCVAILMLSINFSRRTLYTVGNNKPA